MRDVLLTLVLLFAGSTLLPAAAVDQEPTRAAQTAFETGFDRWRAAMARSGVTEEQREEEIGQIAETLFDLDDLASSILEGEWTKLTQREQMTLRAAVRSAMHRIGTPLLSARGMPQSVLELTSTEATGDRVDLEYQVTAPGGAPRRLRAEMSARADGTWRLSDVRLDGTELRRDFRSYARDLHKEYSLPYLVAVLRNADEVILEDFEDGLVDSLPTGWSWKGSDNKKRKPYVVRGDGPNHYLEATDRGESVILGKEIKWNLDEFPYVSFRLQVLEVPEGGDERDDKKVDSAAGIYFTYKRKLGLIPESVKYVWSSTLPVGSAVLRPGTGRPWMVVVGSGRDELGEWRTYVFDLREAYRATFGGDPPSKPLGIGVLSDANSTDSRAYANYDDIKALRRVDGPVPSGVVKILPPVKR